MRVLSADWVVTGEGPPLAGGVVCVDGAGVVVEVRSKRATESVERLDGVLLPGLVNAHTHLEGSAFRGKVPDGSGLASFLWGYLGARRTVGADEVATAARAAVGALHDAGTALVGEVTNTLVAVPMLAETPIHAAVFHEMNVLSERGVFDARAAARTARSALAALPERIRIAEAAHATYSAPPSLIRACYRAAEVSRGLTSLHVAEHPEERLFLADRTGPIAEGLRTLGMELDWPAPGRGPVEHVETLGALGPASLAVHVADATPEERDTLRERRSPVVLCPRSNARIGGALPDLPGLLEAGIRPALGTDSLASSPSVDVLEEATALHRAYPRLHCRTLLAMCTAWGAAALRRPKLGAIRPGYSPGILHAAGDTVPDDPEGWLVDACPPRRWVVSPGGAA